jgi:hypothetical protein
VLTVVYTALTVVYTALTVVYTALTFIIHVKNYSLPYCSVNKILSRLADFCVRCENIFLRFLTEKNIFYSFRLQILKSGVNFGWIRLRKSESRVNSDLRRRIQSESKVNSDLRRQILSEAKINSDWRRQILSDMEYLFRTFQTNTKNKNNSK